VFIPYEFFDEQFGSILQGISYSQRKADTDTSKVLSAFTPAEGRALKLYEISLFFFICKPWRFVYSQEQ
jgi:hypothetical protein